jgi:hypothetical protein
MAKPFDSDVDTGYFPLDSVLATSEFFEHGRRPQLADQDVEVRGFQDLPDQAF